MDRETLIQFVALLVVLVACLRWLPDDQPDDALGLGMPWETLRMEQQLLKLGPSSDEAMTFLRTASKGPDRQASYRRHWVGWMRQMNNLLQSPELTPDTLVQFRGIPRNDMWALMYMLYPQPTTFVTYEGGSRPFDDPIPGALQLDSTLMRWEDLTEEQRARERARLGR